MVRLLTTCFVMLVALLAGCTLTNPGVPVADYGPPEVTSVDQTSGDESAAAPEPTPFSPTPRINLEFADTDIKIVLDLLAKQSGSTSSSPKTSPARSPCPYGM